MQTQALKCIISPSFFYRDRSIVNTRDLKTKVFLGLQPPGFLILGKSAYLCVSCFLKNEGLMKTRVPRVVGGGSLDL